MKLVWYRRDLRTVDHSALNHAIVQGDAVAAVFVATPEQWRQHGMAPIQADFIARRLAVVRDELSQLNVPLYYLEVDTFQDSVSAVAALAQRIHADEVLVNIEYELNECRRDSALKSDLERLGIAYREFHDKCFQPPGHVLNQQGSYFKVFTPFQKAWRSFFYVPDVSVTPMAKPQDPRALLTTCLYDPSQSFRYPRISSEAWSVQSLSMMEQLEQFCREKVATYHQYRDFPAIDGTSSLSPYLAIGALSVRQCLKMLYDESDGGLGPGAESWLNELIWREFYQHLIVFKPALCRGDNFHAWGDHLHWVSQDEALIRWQAGMTGYPIVDAAMRQLNQTGWMHNRLRMIVASFLTKDLHIDWRLGEAYFMHHLIDGDFAANNGGWQWSASTGCDGQPYFRIFNPITQGQRFDPEGHFIRRWIPELSSVSDRWCHEPWKDRSVNSLSYPSPIVDHQVERKLTLSIYQAAKEGCKYVP